MTIYISIRKWGRLGNHLIQYMGALSLVEKIGDAKICNFDIPEFGIYTETLQQYPSEAITIRQHEDIDLNFLCKMATNGPDVIVNIDWHMQRMEYLRSPDYYAKQFPILHDDVPSYSREFIVINVRAEDIRDGFASWYPLMPIEFYRDIVAKTSCVPVFMGQLEDCEYVRALRGAFPDALFVEKSNAGRDFDLIRKAKNIVVSVSTFSWVAAWLSEATNIYLPLNGWLNPAHMRHTDLVPDNDMRYRFFLFPMNFAMPEKKALLLHNKMEGMWREISPSHARFLRTTSPILPRLRPSCWVNERWYFHNYLDAAMDVSLGLYEDAAHHYADVGRLRGYSATPRLKRQISPRQPLVSKKKKAWQSTLSAWSLGKTIASDASGAVDGHIDKEYGFHTAKEINPWWVVDLGEKFRISAVVIYNRNGSSEIEARAFPLSVEYSIDSELWTVLYETDPDEQFGTDDGPLCCRCRSPVVARFVRVVAPGENRILHLAQVEVHGERI